MRRMKMEIINLLEETVAVIKNNGHSVNDVLYVGNMDASLRIDWATAEHVLNVDYDRDYGSQKIAKDLVVRFNDGGFLSRREYDGAEWWAFAPPFIPSEHPRKFRLVMIGDNALSYYDTLHDINYPNEVKE
jgi:hypothetical protein